MNQNQTQTITNEEREGVGMIQALLTFGGQSEPEEVSLANWRKMADWEQEETRQTFYLICGQPEGNDEET